MNWNTFKDYFDPHKWAYSPSMRTRVCLTCSAYTIHLDKLKRSR